MHKDNFNIGEYAEILVEKRTFKIFNFTKGRRTIPDGWLVEKDGIAVNPRFCEPRKNKGKYKINIKLNPCICGGNATLYTDGITTIVCDECGIILSNSERSMVKLTKQWNKLNLIKRK